MPQRVRMAGRNPGLFAVIAEHCAQPGGSQRLAPVRALGDDEQRGAVGLWPFGEQVGLDHAGDVVIDRHPALLVALADDSRPPAGDIDVSNLQAEDLAGPQAGHQHQPGDGPVPPRTEAAQQQGGLLP